MDVHELVKRGSEEVVAIYCGKCGIVYRMTERESAEQCCKPSLCKKCGKEARVYRTICDECYKVEIEAKEQARFEKAEKIQFNDYDVGALFCDGLGNDGYVYDVRLELEDMEPKDRPRWMWACTEVRIPKPDAVDVIERMTYDTFEDAENRFDLDGLQRVLDEWYAKQESVIYYEADERKAVLLDSVLAEIAAEEALTK